MMQVHLLAEISAKVRNGSRNLRALALRAGSNIRALTYAPQIFYPAFSETTAQREAGGITAEAKSLTVMMQVESASDDLFDASVMLLLERIKHHVEAQELPGGRLAEAKESDGDVQAWGEQSVREESQTGDEAA
jgi:hypothetical protein